MGGVTKRIGNTAGGIVNDLGFGGIGSIGVTLEKVLQGGDQRAAFNAILLATVAHGSKKPSFNLEVEINDLMVRLGNLRGLSSVSGALGNVGALYQGIDSLINSLIKK